MKQADTGDTVLVHYRGTLADGTEFDSSAGGDPIKLTIGERQVIPGFENALVGMARGETKSITLEPEDAYGPHSPKLVQTVERARIPEEIDLAAGMALQASDAQGNPMRLVVVEFNTETVTLDANHPLAGKALTFELTLAELVE